MPSSTSPFFHHTSYRLNLNLDQAFIPQYQAHHAQALGTHRLRLSVLLLR